MDNTISLKQLSAIFLKDSWTISKFLKSRGIDPIDKDKHGLKYHISVVEYLQKAYSRKIELFYPVYITTTYIILESKMNKKSK